MLKIRNISKKKFQKLFTHKLTSFEFKSKFQNEKIQTIFNILRSYYIASLLYFYFVELSASL